MTYILGSIILGFVFAVLFGRFCKIGRGDQLKRDLVEFDEERL